ncbi:ankyrin repeat and SAM domain-containing protein 4B-like isoform X2 [Olea europaea var. sylvestris]|uniref:ankyrin repeat and SAM domain-containing protein 4B-like isoform X2 n=1 Tax=Olea europaea var. sylvestris TaxID=158386 RepID=UPI000C1D7336|nr:ankyrin repeat and SAM domain-containing protein 4B-like isoform X2 [Olea europaea var. sylvestris]
MYADRVEAEAQSSRSIKERLNGSSAADSGRRRPVSGKRRREDDDKWEHDLFEENEPQVSNRRIGAKDLRLKLQRKSIEQASQTRGSVSGGMRDLREKLSGSLYSRPGETKPSQPRSKPALEVSKPTRKSVVAEATVPDSRRVTGPVSDKKNQLKAESVDSFLESLGLEKYSITFQAEEVDMITLVHMGDEDLKALGIPMGPRKKILLALESKV